MDIGIPTATAKDVLAVHQIESGKPGDVRPSAQPSPTMFTDALIALLDSVKWAAATVAPLRTPAAIKGNGTAQAPHPSIKKEAGRSKDEQETGAKRSTEGQSGFAQNESAAVPPTFVAVEPVKTEANSRIVVCCETQHSSDDVASGVETAFFTSDTSATTRPAGVALEAPPTMSVPNKADGGSEVALGSPTEQLAAKIIFAGSGQAVAAVKDTAPRTGTISPEPGLPQSQTLPGSARHLASSSPVPQFTKEEAHPNVGETATPNVRTVAVKKNVISASAPLERSVPHEAKVLSFRTGAISAVASDSFSASSSLGAEAYSKGVDGSQEADPRVREATLQDARDEASAASMALFAGVPVTDSASNARIVQPHVKTDKARAVSATPVKASRNELHSETLAARGLATKLASQRLQDDKRPDSPTAKYSGSGTPKTAGQPDAAIHAPKDSVPAKDSIEPNSPSSAPQITPTQDPGDAPTHAPIRGADIVGHPSSGQHVSTIPGSREQQASANTASHASGHVESRPSPLLVQNVRLVQQSAHAEIKLELRTPEAGKVEVHTVTRDGRTEAVIAAELGDTRQALMNALPEMQQRFHDNNVHIQFQSSLGTTMEGHDGGQRQGQRNEPSPTPQQQDSSLEPAPSPVIPEISSESSSRATLNKLSVHA